MQLRLFRHFVPVSVVLLASSDALIITCAFYQLLSYSELGTPILLGASSFSAQFSAGLSVATVTAMVSVGLYGQQSFMDFRLLFGKIVVASIFVLMLVSFSATYWRDGLNELTDFTNFPFKATLIWLVCVSVTRGTFSVTLGRGLLKRRIVVLGDGIQAARIAKLVETGQNDHFIPVSFIDLPARTTRFRSEILDWSAAEPDGLAEIGCRLGATEIVVAADDRRGRRSSPIMPSATGSGRELPAGLKLISRTAPQPRMPAAN
jgi:FlaA1/EpsC-like NDP-sugar epimerase